MKKHLLTCLLAITLAVSFAFTTNYEAPSKIEAQTNFFKRYQVVLSTVYNVPGTHCTISVGILITFDWLGNGTQPTLVSVSSPIFVPHCPPNSTETREGTVNSTTLNTDAHLTDISFGSTGDSYVDSIISSQDFINWFKGEFNSNVDSQKK